MIYWDKEYFNKITAIGLKMMGHPSYMLKSEQIVSTL